ncbi:MAG: hypothetical protein GY832_37005 [Chloroflexi bacterium]|nr:hypothetical protein [Chloroflexota bacterium]
MLTRSGKMVDPKDTHAAIESAYAKLPDGERARVDELVNALTGQTPRGHGFGEQAARQTLAAIGMYLVEHPKIQARFDDSACFIKLSGKSHPRVKQNDKLERALRFFRRN